MNYRCPAVSIVFTLNLLVNRLRPRPDIYVNEVLIVTIRRFPGRKA